MDDQDNSRIFEYSKLRNFNHSNIRNFDSVGYCKIRKSDLVDVSTLIVHLMLLVNESKSKLPTTSESIKEAGRIVSMLSAMIQESDCE